MEQNIGVNAEKHKIKLNFIKLVKLTQKNRGGGRMFAHKC